MKFATGRTYDITVDDVGKKEKARHTWFWYGFEKKNEVLNDKEPYVG